MMETGKKALGIEHSSLLTEVSNLSLTYRSQGRLKEAEEQEVRAMETRKKVRGAARPDTLIRRYQSNNKSLLLTHDVELLEWQSS
jgi:hypothetical protein